MVWDSEHSLLAQLPLKLHIVLLVRILKLWFFFSKSVFLQGMQGPSGAAYIS